MTDVFRVIFAGALALGLGACNTIGGFGQDVEEGGAAISDTAQDAEQELE